MKHLRQSVFADAISYVVLGLREAIAPKLILFSIGLWLGAVVVWGMILLFAWSLVKTLAGFIRSGSDTSKLASAWMGCRSLLAGDMKLNRLQAGSYKAANEL
jgi:hypothetical protein